MCQDVSNALSLTSSVWTEIMQCVKQTLSLSGRKGTSVSGLEMEGMVLAPYSPGTVRG